VGLGSSLAGIAGSSVGRSWMSVCCECYHVKVSAMGRSLDQRSPTGRDVFVRRTWPTRVVEPRKKNVDYLYTYIAFLKL
jgi:hypothetical protein